jgi:hypothetical protein
MEQIIEAIDKDLLIKELTHEKFIRHTNNAGNDLYIFSATDSPNLMKEVGRLRELTFRSAGGGTGQGVDIDEYDICQNCYKQLIVWDPKEHEIIGGYRFHSVDPRKGEEINLSTKHLFNFSDKFIIEYMPFMIELGRSFIQPKYQSALRAGKGLYALDNLWDGLGALIVINPDIKYFFGKVTMYHTYNKEARNTLLYFFEKYFADKENLVTPIYPMQVEMDRDKLGKLFHGKDYKNDYKILSHEIKELGERIPPLINSYMNLSPSMKVFGTVLNPYFGGVEETGIMITIDDIYQHKVERHISSFLRKIKAKYYHLGEAFKEKNKFLKDK